MSKWKQIQIADVVALWPRLNQPYRYNKNLGEKGGNEPCEATADQAKYETSFDMTPTQAEAIWKEMKQAYELHKEADWPALTMPFKKKTTDHGITTYEYKAAKKAAYDGKPSYPPTQWDANANKLPPEFELTTGSKINMNVKLIPYNTSLGHGVSLRLIALQVITLAERSSPFDKVDNGMADEDEEEYQASSNPFKKVEKKQDAPFGEFKLEAETDKTEVKNDLDDEIPF